MMASCSFNSTRELRRTRADCLYHGRHKNGAGDLAAELVNNTLEYLEVAAPGTYSETAHR